MANIFARAVDSLIKLYLLLHLFLGIALDSQSVLPRRWYPDYIWNVVGTYAAKLGDNLVRVNPPWFVALVWMEVLIQMPLTVALLYGYAQGSAWIRQLGLVYAVHVLTTMPPILNHFESTLKPPHKYCVFGVYAPWLVMPVVMLARFTVGAPKSTRRKSGAKASAAKKRK